MATKQVLRTTEATGPACCPSSLIEPIDQAAAVAMARLFKAVANPARLRLLSILRSNVGHEACVCDLTELLGLSQATVSHHLKVLADAGIVQCEKRGYWTWYSLIPSRLAELAAVLA